MSGLETPSLFIGNPTIPGATTAFDHGTPGDDTFNDINELKRYLLLCWINCGPDHITSNGRSFVYDHQRSLLARARRGLWRAPTISQSITETGGNVTIGGASGTAFSGTINFSETFSASETATTNGVEVGSGGQPTISQSITETGGNVTIGGASGTAFSGTINFSETFSASETATTNGVEVGSTFSLTGTLQIGGNVAVLHHLGEYHLALGVEPALLDPHASEVNLKARSKGLVERAGYGVSHERTAPKNAPNDRMARTVVPIACDTL